MSRKWRSVVIIAFVMGVISVILGFVLPELDSFLGNILAGIAVSAFAFAIAVLLIEGPVLTRERRVSSIGVTNQKPEAPSALLNNPPYCDLAGEGNAPEVLCWA